MKKAVKNIRKTTKTTINILLWLSVLLALFTLAGSVFKNERQLSPWGTGIFTVKTGSMTPKIPTGSLIFVAEIPAEKIKIGDVLTFYGSNNTNDSVTTHRVVDIDIKNFEYFYITRGDANNINDSPVSYDKIIGRVIFSLPLLGLLPGLFRNPVFIGSLTAVIGGGILILGIRDIRKKQNSAKSAKNDKLKPLLLLILSINIINIIIIYLYSAAPSGAWWHIRGSSVLKFSADADISDSKPEETVTPEFTEYTEHIEYTTESTESVESADPVTEPVIETETEAEIPEEPALEVFNIFDETESEYKYEYEYTNKSEELWDIKDDREVPLDLIGVLSETEISKIEISEEETFRDITPPAEPAKNNPTTGDNFIKTVVLLYIIIALCGCTVIILRNKPRKN